MRGVSGVQPTVPDLTIMQLLGRHCVWCADEARTSGRPRIRLRAWGIDSALLIACGGSGVACRDWVTADWLARHPDVKV